jgi:hypothetical protein
MTDDRRDAEDTPPATGRTSATEYGRTLKELLESHPDGVPKPDLHAARFDIEARFSKLVSRALVPVEQKITNLGHGLQSDRRRAKSAHALAIVNLVALLVVCFGVAVVWRGQIDTGRQIEELRRELGETRHDLERRLDADAARIENLERRVMRIEKEIETP